MAKTRESKKMSTKKKAAIGTGVAALSAGLGYGAYKLGPKAVKRLKESSAGKKVGEKLGNWQANRAAKKAAKQKQLPLPGLL